MDDLVGKFSPLGRTEGSKGFDLLLNEHRSKKRFLESAGLVMMNLPLVSF
jgi:hypothetical protein